MFLSILLTHVAYLDASFIEVLAKFFGSISEELRNVLEKHEELLLKQFFISVFHIAIFIFSKELSIIYIIFFICQSRGLWYTKRT